MVQRKIQFGYILETFENFNKRKTLVGPQVIPRSIFKSFENVPKLHFSLQQKIATFKPEDDIINIETGLLFIKL